MSRRRLPARPERPPGFYSSWNTFCAEVLLAWIHEARNTTRLAGVLLAASATLGLNGFFFFQKHRQIIDQRGEQMGLKNLGEYVASTGPMGGALLMRRLSQFAGLKTVDTIQDILASGRHAFRVLQQDRRKGALDESAHHLALETMFSMLTAK